MEETDAGSRVASQPGPDEAEAGAEQESELRPMEINLGPQHPSTHGVLRVVLELNGESVVSCTPHIGYLHTGMEKTIEHQRYQQAITIVDRMDYLSPMTNELGFVLAVEKLLGIEVPRRAQVIRIINAELSRIASHLVWLGTHAMDMGAMSVFFYCFRERELILDLWEAAAGQRMNPTYMRIGGLDGDVPDGWVEKARAFVEEFPTWVRDYYRLLDQNPLWVERLRGNCFLTVEDAIAHGITGPMLRGSGLALDLRKSAPYAGYEEYDFDVPVGERGDAFDRYMVRMREMEESRKIIAQALDRLEPGPVSVRDDKIVPPPKEEISRSMEALIYHFKLMTEGLKVPAGEVYLGIEGPKGEIGYYIVSDGSARPFRCRVRPPCFYNLQGLPLLVRGQLVADVVTAIGSTDIVLGEVDR